MGNSERYIENEKSNTNELKTLKDIKKEFGTSPAKNILFFNNRIKQEAIKDYHKWEKHPNGQNVCIYIIWKNNLTEEDLK